MSTTTKQRFKVTPEMADLCLSFLLDQGNDGQDYACPNSMHDAVQDYINADVMGDRSRVAHAKENFRTSIERWMVIDRAACVGLLGPGLGIEQ